ncbi:MAG: M23 family metallopeptidase [Defluviitaleaceae bacterium]|nr:M23 family metallopeptidase [Defluviitaleaceae bacterium]
MHTGIDIAVPVGTPVLAVSCGVVLHTGSSALNGKYIRLETDLGYSIVYAHLDKIYAERAQRVEQGEVVGRSGNTGRSSGPHLHYGVYRDGDPLDPAAYLNIIGYAVVD